MGIKNFFKFISKYSPESIEITNIKKYQNSIIGIDFNLMLYKLIFSIRRNGYDIKNNNIIVTHIHALLLKLIKFNQYNILAVFVFDGKPPNIKLNTLKKREIAWEKMAIKFKEAKNDEERKKYYYLSTGITDQEYIDCKNLIKIFGYPIIESIQEADSQLAYLSKNNLIDYIVSDDLDILLFGGKKILKKFSVNDNRKITQEINLDILKETTNFTQDDLIKLGILLGSDYCDNKTLSITKAYKYIINHGVIDNKCDPAIRYFKNPKIKKINKINYTNDIQINKLIKFLELFQFDNKYINNVITKIS